MMISCQGCLLRLGWTGILIDLDEVVSDQNCCAAALRH